MSNTTFSLPYHIESTNSSNSGGTTGNHTHTNSNNYNFTSGESETNGNFDESTSPLLQQPPAPVRQPTAPKPASAPFLPFQNPIELAKTAAKREFGGAFNFRPQQQQTAAFSTRAGSGGNGDGRFFSNMINLSKVHFFGTNIHNSLMDWFKRPKASFNDAIDRLNCQMVPLLLLFFVTVNSANILGFIGGDPMWCLPSKDLSKEEFDYALDYCKSKNQYYVAPEEGIPWSDVERNKRQLGYYHWVPITLLLQALLFSLPNWLWTALNKNSGIDYVKLLTEARDLRDLKFLDPQRTIQLDALANGINMGVMDRMPRRLHGFRFGRSLGHYVSSLYVFVKFLYLLNVLVQFFFLNAFIGRAYQMWGYEVLLALIAGNNWQDSPIFPRLTLCDIPIRRLGDTPRYTIQCHLRINTYNEKIYLFIWWTLLMVAALTLVNFLYYFVYLQMPFVRERSARYLLRQDQYRNMMNSDSPADQRIVRKFANESLRHDGVLLFWFIEGHAGPLVARELMARIFQDYLNINGYQADPTDVFALPPNGKGGLPNAPEEEEEIDTDEEEGDDYDNFGPKKGGGHFFAPMFLQQQQSVDENTANQHREEEKRQQKQQRENQKQHRGSTGQFFHNLFHKGGGVPKKEGGGARRRSGVHVP